MVDWEKKEGKANPYSNAKRKKEVYMIRIRKFIKKPSKWPFVSIALVMVLAMVLGTVTAFAVDPRPCPDATDPPASDAIGTVITMYAVDIPWGSLFDPDNDLFDPRFYNEALWDYFPSAASSGTGVFDTYLAVQSPGNSPDEQGFNTGGKCKDYNEGDSKTSALPLSAVPIKLIDMDDGQGAILYREFVCDINESKKGIPDQYISLEVLQIWQSDNPNLCGLYNMEADYNFDPDPSFDDPRLVYDLDCGEDLTLILDYGVNNGSGKPDYQVYVPNSWFDQELLYVIMVVDHGNNEATLPGTGDSAGFEEWGVKLIETATKSGTKFHDLNANSIRDGGEPGLGGWTIFVDYDDNDQLDAGEPSAVTAGDGSYTITDIIPGTWKVREVAQVGWNQSYPVSGYHEETFEGAMSYPDNDFGNWYPASKSGIKYEDENANGQQDGGELGLGGWTIYVDIDDSGTLNAGDLSDVTASDGSYNITGIPPGTYDVREVIQAGWTCTEPNAAGVYADEVFTSSDQITDNDFGNYQRACWGDETAWAHGGGYAKPNWDYVNDKNWGWTNGPLPEGSYVWDVYAGAGQNDLSKGTVAGTVSVNYTAGCVNVTYNVDPGYYLGETHLWVGNKVLPEVTRGKRTVYTNDPGQFPYGVDYGFDPADSGTWETEWTWSGCGFSGDIYVAAHGVVWMEVECPEEPMV